MYKKLIIAVLFAVTGSFAYADETAAVTNTTEVVATSTAASSQTGVDQTMQKIWENVDSSTKTLTFTAATFYDAVNGELLYGASAEVRRLSTTTDWVKYVGVEFTMMTTGASGAHGLPGIGAKVHVNEIVKDKMPGVYEIVTKIDGGSAVLSNMTAGGWVTRDFYEGKWRAGAYLGFEFKYGISK